MTNQRLPAAVLFAIAALAIPARAHFQEATGSIPALMVKMADGRTTTRPLSPSGWESSTQAFPRIAGADTDREGLPLKAMEFRVAREGPIAVVEVALLYGSPNQHRVRVAVKRVVDQPVPVDELQAYGVQPIVLSIVRLSPTELTVPAVTCPSSRLEVVADTDSSGVPTYRFSITNRSMVGVMALSFHAYRGNRPTMSGRPRGPRYTELIEPGETYELRFAASPNAAARGMDDRWLTTDRLVITSVLWSDGTVEGDPTIAADEQLLAAGAAKQLARAVPLLRAVPPDEEPAALRARLDALNIDITAEDLDAARASLPGSSSLSADAARATMRSGMQNVKIVALRDLDAFIQTGNRGTAYGKWLSFTAAEYDTWLRRITRPGRRLLPTYRS